MDEDPDGRELALPLTGFAEDLLGPASGLSRLANIARPWASRAASIACLSSSASYFEDASRSEPESEEEEDSESFSRLETRSSSDDAGFRRLAGLYRDEGRLGQ